MQKSLLTLTLLIIVAIAYVRLIQSKRADIAQVSMLIVKIEVTNKLGNLAKFAKQAFEVK